MTTEIGSHPRKNPKNNYLPIESLSKETSDTQDFEKKTSQDLGHHQYIHSSISRRQHPSKQEFHPLNNVWSLLDFVETLETIWVLHVFAWIECIHPSFIELSSSLSMPTHFFYYFHIKPWYMWVLCISMWLMSFLYMVFS